MEETALVIMAAGMGTRYGGGIKQIARVGPSGEAIIDYSIYDALKAGFSKIVFIIRKDIEADFREVVGNHIEKVARVEYVFQELDDLPEGFRAPEGRTKPWGTGHAIWTARHVVDCPFVVINADDFYGSGSYKIMHDFLVNDMSDDRESCDYCMAGYILGNTLSDIGTVSRGICSQDDMGYLRSVVETYHIGWRDGVIKGDDIRGNEYTLDEGVLCSMNMWGLKANIMDVLDKGFKEFLSRHIDNPRAEYLLPFVMDRLIRSGEAKIKVLPISDKWYGVTYKEDKQVVTDAIRAMVDEGIYEEKLFG